jgi:hypothetical protein
MAIQQAPTIAPYQGGQAASLLAQQQANKQAKTGQAVGAISQLGGLLASFIPIVGPILGPLLGMGGSAAGGAIAQDRSATDAHIQQSTQPAQPIQAPQVGTPVGGTNTTPQANDLSAFLSGLGQQRMG